MKYGIAIKFRGRDFFSIVANFYDIGQAESYKKRLSKDLEITLGKVIIVEL
jgi:hypothetical protein